MGMVARPSVLFVLLVTIFSSLPAQATDMATCLNLAMACGHGTDLKNQCLDCYSLYASPGFQPPAADATALDTLNQLGQEDNFVGPPTQQQAQASAAAEIACNNMARSWCLTQSVSGKDPCTDSSLGCVRILGTACNANPSGRCAGGLITSADNKCFCPSGHLPQNTPVTSISQCRRQGDVTTQPGPGPQSPAVPEDPQNPGQGGGNSPGGGGGTAPQDPGSAQQEAQADMQSCQQAQKQANTCCVSNPQSCIQRGSTSTAPPPAKTGDAAQDQAALNSYCKQLEAEGLSGGTTSGGAGAACMQRHRQCSSTCEGLAQKYNQLLSNCGNCASRSIYQQMVSALSQYNSTCKSYASRVAALGNMGLDSGMASAQSSVCANMSSANPLSQMANGMNKAQEQGTGGAGSDRFGCEANPNSPACIQCAQNPNAPSCRAMMAKPEGGKTGFSEEKEENKGDFNLVDGGDLPYAPGPVATGTPGAPGTPNKTIPNNSGGGIGGGGSNAAQLGGGGRAGSPGSPGYDTNIEQGLRSGGGGGGLGGGFQTQSADAGGYDGGFGGRGPAGANGGAMDLRKYLPGGSADPNRRLGGLNSLNREINGAHVNIWERISTRLKEKCKLRILVGCESGI